MTCDICDGTGRVGTLAGDAWTPCPTCTAKPKLDIVDWLKLAKFPVRIWADPPSEDQSNPLVAEAAAAEITRLRAEVERLSAENLRLRNVLADAHNKWRHEFAAAVDQETDKLFKRLSATQHLQAPKP